MYMCDLRKESDANHKKTIEDHPGKVTKIVLKTDGAISSTCKAVTFWKFEENDLQRQSVYCPRNQQVHDFCYCDHFDALFIAVSSSVEGKFGDLYKDLVTISEPIRQLQLCSRNEQNQIILYTLSVSSILRGWILDVKNEWNTSLLFEKVDCQMIAVSKVSIEHFYAISSSNTVCQAHASSGAIIREFRTFALEAISSLEVSLHENKDVVIFSTMNSLYVDDQLRSSGGSTKDGYCNIRDVKFASRNNLVGYTCDEQLAPGGSRGVVAILSNDPGKRIGTFYQPSRVLFWNFMDSSRSCLTKWVVTIGSDDIVRVFDLKIGSSEAIFTEQCFLYPLNYKVSSLVVGTGEPVLYLGDAAGRVRGPLKFFP